MIFSIIIHLIVFNVNQIFYNNPVLQEKFNGFDPLRVRAIGSTIGYFLPLIESFKFTTGFYDKFRRKLDTK